MIFFTPLVIFHTVDPCSLKYNDNPIERTVKLVALGWWQYNAIVYTLIDTAKLKENDSQALQKDVLSHIANHEINRIDEFLLWNYVADE